jgi:hypothetical protein
MGKHTRRSRDSPVPRDCSENNTARVTSWNASRNPCDLSEPAESEEVLTQAPPSKTKHSCENSLNWGEQAEDGMMDLSINTAVKSPYLDLFESTA